jgi:hypothetical protein
MTFAVAGFFEDLLAGPVEISEVIGEQNAGEKGGSAGATAHSERDFVVQKEVEWLDRPVVLPENAGVGSEDEVAFEAGA